MTFSLDADTDEESPYVLTNEIIERIIDFVMQTEWSMADVLNLPDSGNTNQDDPSPTI